MREEAFGTYVLLLYLPEPRVIPIGALGSVSFRPGHYAYVGSALGGFRARIGRHLKDKKALRWHIDYLRASAEIEGAVLFPGTKAECLLAQRLSGPFSPVPGFGSGGCRCRTHLFFHPFLEDLKAFLMGEAQREGLPALFLSRDSLTDYIKDLPCKGRSIS